MQLEKHQNTRKKKFLIVEGIYEKNGTLCVLPKLLPIAHEFKLRIFIDESVSFGVLGVNGKGITEHYQIDVGDVDLIIGSLENALGSIGGFCAGSKSLIEYQRENGSAQSYAATLPTYLSQTCVAALPIVKNNSIFLQILATKFQEFLCTLHNIKVISDPISPLKIIRYESNGCRNMLAEESIYEFCRDNYVYMVLGTNGITLHLNVELYFNGDRLKRVYQVLEAALDEFQDSKY